MTTDLLCPTCQGEKRGAGLCPECDDLFHVPERDRDRDREADETQSGSVERSEIEPGPQASPKPGPDQPTEARSGDRGERR